MLLLNSTINWTLSELGKYEIKSDIYSVKIIFFGMLYFMSTKMERKNVIEKLRLVSFFFTN